MRQCAVSYPAARCGTPDLRRGKLDSAELSMTRAIFCQRSARLQAWGAPLPARNSCRWAAPSALAAAEEAAAEPQAEEGSRAAADRRAEAAPRARGAAAAEAEAEAEAAEEGAIHQAALKKTTCRQQMREGVRTLRPIARSSNRNSRIIRDCGIKFFASRKMNRAAMPRECRRLSNR